MTRDAHALALAIRIVSDRAWKRCSCGRGYSREEWHALPFVGLYVDDELGICLEQRNCDPGCGSTMAIDRTEPANDGGDRR